MQWVKGGASKRRFEALVAGTTDALFRTGYLMTGDAGDAEDLVQETFIRVARRWHRLESMDHPAAYARRILINLVLDGAERRSRQRAELEPPGSRGEPADESATRALRGIEDLAEFRWALADTGWTCRWPRSRGSSAARQGRSRAPHPGQQPGWPGSSPTATHPQTGPAPQ